MRLGVFDASKNQSRSSWCEWRCGNRAKTRTHRARRRATAPGHETTPCPNGAVASHHETRLRVSPAAGEYAVDVDDALPRTVLQWHAADREGVQAAK